MTSQQFWKQIEWVVKSFAQLHQCIECLGVRTMDSRTPQIGFLYHMITAKAKIRQADVKHTVEYNNII